MPWSRGINGLELTTLAKALIDFVGIPDAVTNRFCPIETISASAFRNLDSHSLSLLPVTGNEAIGCPPFPPLLS